MPSGRYKSRTLRRVFRRVPSSKIKLQYRKRKPRNAVCGSCGALLKGVPRERPYKMRSMSRSKKRPQRPYAGNLCSRCMRKKIIAIARTGA